MDERMRMFYENAKRNPNNMSNWLPKVQGKGFNIPETIIISIPMERFLWLTNDDYQPEAIRRFNDWLASEIRKTGFDTNRELFMKTGNFSDKFLFTNPYLKDMDNIGEKFLHIIYDSMCVGCDPSPEAVVREFIQTSYERKSIYHGMKLNTEFRVFYDFTEKRLLKIFNYWDTETMLKGLYDEDDLKTFKQECGNIEKDFKKLCPSLEKECSVLSEVELSGIWSVDFLWDGEKFWLIDMAIGQQSAYYDKL